MHLMLHNIDNLMIYTFVCGHAQLEKTKNFFNTHNC